MRYEVDMSGEQLRGYFAHIPPNDLESAVTGRVVSRTAGKAPSAQFADGESITRSFPWSTLPTISTGSVGGPER